MDLCVIPTWKQSVNDMKFQIDKFVRSQKWDPLFIFEIKTWVSIRTCQYFMIRQPSSKPGIAITSGKFGRIPDIIQGEIFGSFLFEEFNNIDLIYSAISTVETFGDAISYLYQHVYDISSISIGVLNKYRDHGVSFSKEFL